MPPTPALYGLLGYPLETTLSPALHQAALRWAGLPGTYLALPTAPEALPAAIAGARAWKLPGLNVTVPHKTAVMALLDGLTPQAREIGAVNTLFWRDGALWGDNTDYAGFRMTLDEARFRARPAVVLGAGGAARAVVAALRDLGARPIHLLARRPEAARALLEELVPEFSRGQALPLGPLTPEGRAALGSAALVVNATSAPQSPLEAADYAALPPDVWLYDLRYLPAETPFLEEGRARGLSGINGLDMLLGQAAHAFERWTGQRPPLEVMRQALHEPTESRSSCSVS